MELLAVYTTVDSPDAARSMARALVARGLAACAQITPIESVYVWDGELQQHAEWRILFKTTAARYDDVEAAIRELHGYELPAIHAVAVERVHAPYRDWVEAGIGDG
jgi:periplasmic divalent cation tolerance protein